MLTAVDHLDQIRYRLPEGLNFEPPKVRQSLMKLHGMVMDASNGSTKHSLEDISAEADEIEWTIREIHEHAEKLLTILSDLDTVLNEVWNRLEMESDEEEEE